MEKLRRSLRLITLAPVTATLWAPLLLFGGGLLFGLPPAYAQQGLPKPRIFDELPPPSPSLPPSTVPTFNVPTSPSPSPSPSTVPTFDVPTSPPPSPSPSTVPTFNGPTSPPPSPDTAPSEREFNFQAPSPSPSPSVPPGSPSLDANLYRVDIDGASPLLLSQIRQIEPQAFVRRGEGVIQAGLFADEYNAQSRVRELAAQGIRAQVTPIAAGTEAIALGADVGTDVGTDVGVVNSERLSRGSSYFVVIPGDSTDLPNIVAEVVKLGVPESAVSQRDAPRGPHVAIGPFDSRGDADRWSTYFRSLGMDARVYFGR